MPNDFIRQLKETLLRDVPQEQITDYYANARATSETYTEAYTEVESVLIVAYLSGVPLQVLLRAAFFMGITVIQNEIEEEQFNAEFNPTADA